MASRRGRQRARRARASGGEPAGCHSARLDDARDGRISTGAGNPKASALAPHPCHRDYGPRPHGRRSSTSELCDRDRSHEGIVQPNRPRRADPPSAEQGSPISKGAGGCFVTRILYVEDNDDNVYMLKMRLELIDGFEVLVAENGEIACQVALAERPDLIVMDLDLPVLDGWKATRLL